MQSRRSPGCSSSASSRQEMSLFCAARRRRCAKVQSRGPKEPKVIAGDALELDREAAGQERAGVERRQGVFPRWASRSLLV